MAEWWLGGWMDGCVNEWWLGGSMDGCVTEWLLGGWMDGCVGSMRRVLITSSTTIWCFCSYKTIGMGKIFHPGHASGAGAMGESAWPGNHDIVMHNDSLTHSLTHSLHRIA